MDTYLLRLRSTKHKYVICMADVFGRKRICTPNFVNVTYFEETYYELLMNQVPLGY